MIFNILKLLENSNTNIVSNSAKTIWNLSKDDQNKILIKNENGIKILLKTLKNNETNDDIVENVTGSLNSLTLNSDIREEVRKEGGLPFLINLLKSKSEYILENSISALKNCSANEENIIELRKNIPDILVFLENENENILREASLCLKNLAMNDENCLIILKYNVVEKLNKIIDKSKSDSLKKVCLYTINTINNKKKS
jgi:hypothetical protein